MRKTIAGMFRKRAKVIGAMAMANAALSFALSAPGDAQHAGTDLSNASLEDLMTMKVTLVSREEQKMSEVAGAVFVITAEDIDRSGATNIPDILRMVPGLEVAQINANTWAITARGFNLQFADKLLVLIDGRAVYTPLFGGVNWDTVDEPLEDIDRIEVIRGPGGTAWGSNAVNGVINIITKRATNTQGELISGGGGTFYQGFGTLQHGGKWGKSDYRLFSKYLNDDHYPDLNGQNGKDNWHLLHGGFRADSDLSAKTSVTVQGDLYAGSEGAEIVHSVLNPPANIVVERLAGLSGGNVLGRIHHKFSDRSDATIQVYFDTYARSGPEAREDRKTYDLDFQDHFAWGSRQNISWGTGIRHSGAHTVGTIDQAFDPTYYAGELYSLFALDQIVVKPDRLSVTIGTKLEDSYFSSHEVEPSIRVAWTPSDNQTIWGAVSRASRAPTIRDTGLSAVLAALPGPAELLLQGNPQEQSEHVTAYEIGYRAQATQRFSFDATVFMNAYDHLQSIVMLSDVMQSNPPLLIHRETFGNALHGTTHGIEAVANWNITRWWIVSPSYSLLQINLRTNPGSADTTSASDTEGTTPHHQAQLSSRVNLARRFAWDTRANFVDRLPAPMIAAYTRLDSRLSWEATESLQISVVGQNLLQDHHVEFNNILQSVNSSEIKRSAYAEFRWRF